MTQQTAPDIPADMTTSRWSEPRPDLPLYLVQTRSIRDGAEWSPVAWCHRRPDALDVAELWAEEFPARVLVRDPSGAVSLYATVNPQPPTAQWHDR